MHRQTTTGMTAEHDAILAERIENEFTWRRRRGRPRKLSLARALHEGYSRGLFEKVECDDRGDCLGEGGEGASVVGVEDAPVLEVGDGSFDVVADRVHVFTEVVFPFEGVAVGAFSEGGDHSQADVAFVAEPVLRFHALEDAAGAKRCDVVAVSVDGVGDPGETAAEVTGNLDVHACGGVLAGPEGGAVRPGPAGERGAVDDVLTVDVEVVRGRYVIVQGRSDPCGERGDGSGDCRLRDAISFGKLDLSRIPSRVGQGDDERAVESEDRWPFRRRDVSQNSLGKILTFLTGQSCCMLNARPFFL